jgi:hypothetical protein
VPLGARCGRHTARWCRRADTVWRFMNSGASGTYSADGSNCPAVTLPDRTTTDDCIMERLYVGGVVGDLRVHVRTPSQLTTEVGGYETNHGSKPGLALRSNAY